MQKIASAFVAAKKEFSPALKDKTNPAFRSKYADLGACIEAVNDALLNHGIAIYQETSEDDTGVTVETVLLHESGEAIRNGKLHVPAAKHDPQGFGSALTYARRYSLMAACGIAPEDDDGNAATKATQERPPKVAAKAKDEVKPMSADEAEQMCVAMRECDDLDSLMSIFGAGFKRAAKAEQDILKSVYDQCKTNLTKKEAA
jgi:hypothetical protein